jgi:hypothetical protein
MEKGLILSGEAIFLEILRTLRLELKFKQLPLQSQNNGKISTKDL